MLDILALLDCIVLPTVLAITAELGSYFSGRGREHQAVHFELLRAVVKEKSAEADIMSVLK